MEMKQIVSHCTTALLLAVDQVLQSEYEENLQKTLLCFSLHHRTVWKENISTKM
jgi:hypothetical protein